MSGNKTGQYDTVTVVFQSFEVYCYVCWRLVVVNVWRFQVITRKCRYVNLCALVLLHCYAKLRRPTVDSWCCRMTNYELLRWLVETPSRDFEHYRMTDDSWQSIIRHFHVRWKCRMIGFARWRFNLFESRRPMLQRHLPNGVERTQLRSPDCW